MSVRNRSRVGRSLLALTAALALLPLANSQTPDVAHLAVPGAPLSVAVPSVSATAPVELYVRMTDMPLAAVAGNKRTGMKMTGDQQRAYAAQLRQKQGALMAQISSMGGAQLAGLTNATNALVVEIAANQASAIAQLPGVAQVLPVGRYELDLSATVPYIGATALQGLGVDGTGVRVAVLDSGVDFTHRNLGGTGVVADFDTCYAQSEVAPSGDCANYFGPSAPKVIGGYDFVGETWVGGAGSPPLLPDPNPIARRSTGGHGTHVADIILGKSADNTWKGVAPGAKLLAVKVCSAVSTSCSGVAILQGLEWSLDPNGDNDLSDAVDIVNMSLGASYGQRENPAVYSTNVASQFGVVVVVSAGNSADRPFITGSPSMATSAISVAQTQVPGAVGYPLIVTAPPSIAGSYGNTNVVSWAPITSGFSGNVRRAGTACPGETIPDLTGFVALVDRGTCNISLKVDQAALRGAIAVILANNAAGDAPSFSFGGGTNMVQTLVVTQAIGNTLKSVATDLPVVTVGGANSVSLAGSMVSTSSRGPSTGLGMLKPDIGAPGASNSAEVGTGNGNTVFGGTSGAAPMVAGSAALLLQQFPTLLPHEVKARLMNAAETAIFTNPLLLPGQLAPLSRIGGGEVRVNRSLALNTAAWDASDPRAVSLSMGVTRNAGTSVYRKRVLVRNYASVARTYAISTSFRYANDQASGALTLAAPSTISVPANGNATFILTATLNANLLPTWASTGVNGGSQGGNGSLLNLPEYDGFVTISEGTDTVRVPWHILPHRAHNVVAPSALALGGASAPLNLTNTGGSVDGRVDVFYLTGTSPQIPPQNLPMEGSSFTTHDLRAVGVRPVAIGTDSLGNPVFGVQFAVNHFGAASHPAYPRRISVFIDQDGNGTDDFEVFTQESGAFASTGQTLTFVRKLSSTTGSAFFFADADLASGNAILTIPMVATLAGTGANLALTPASTFRYRVEVSDNYFTGAITDSIPPMTVKLDTPRFGVTSFAPGPVPVGGTAGLTVVRTAAGDAAFPSQQGLLMMYRDGKFGREADIVNIAP